MSPSRIWREYLQATDSVSGPYARISSRTEPCGKNVIIYEHSASFWSDVPSCIPLNACSLRSNVTLLYASCNRLTLFRFSIKHQCKMQGTNTKIPLESTPVCWILAKSFHDSVEILGKNFIHRDILHLFFSSSIVCRRTPQYLPLASAPWIWITSCSPLHSRSTAQSARDATCEAARSRSAATASPAMLTSYSGGQETTQQTSQTDFRFAEWLKMYIK